MRRQVTQIQRWWRRVSRPARRLTDRITGRSSPASAADLEPSPGVEAFLAGESMRQVAYFVGSSDPGIIDPRQDWPGAVADAHGVVRDYVAALQARVAELERGVTAPVAAPAPAQSAPKQAPAQPAPQPTEDDEPYDNPILPRGEVTVGDVERALDELRRRRAGHSPRRLDARRKRFV